jgi:hypothetical protein
VFHGEVEGSKVESRCASVSHNDVHYKGRSAADIARLLDGCRARNVAVNQHLHVAVDRVLRVRVAVTPRDSSRDGDHRHDKQAQTGDPHSFR